MYIIAENDVQTSVDFKDDVSKHVRTSARMYSTDRNARPLFWAGNLATEPSNSGPQPIHTSRSGTVVHTAAYCSDSTAVMLLYWTLILFRLDCRTSGKVLDSLYNYLISCTIFSPILCTHNSRIAPKERNFNDSLYFFWISSWKNAAIVRLFLSIRRKTSMKMWNVCCPCY